MGQNVPVAWPERVFFPAPFRSDVIQCQLSFVELAVRGNALRAADSSYNMRWIRSPGTEKAGRHALMGYCADCGGEVGPSPAKRRFGTWRKVPQRITKYEAQK
ncbi:hypothetical protein OU994_05445 [Pseudoduganella sp. SL102]|uniref:hypothetical protein n=1 Tax=Pseudoduganella sp. SL102 TaxID=2995154 RepID=UPI00248BEB14|nr:hypothetical protein [Pseudoduganella sp. SL102]WBS03744.1 hypothetical protein OU994_05445 [Pseudoduganella sp. SL102]